MWEPRRGTVLERGPRSEDAQPLAAEGKQKNDRVEAGSTCMSLW